MIGSLPLHQDSLKGISWILAGACLSVERDFLLVIQSYLLGKMLIPRVHYLFVGKLAIPWLGIALISLFVKVNNATKYRVLVIVGIQNINFSWGSGEQIGNLLTSRRLSCLVIACISGFLLLQLMQQQITASSRYSITQGNNYHPLWGFSCEYVIY